MDDANRSNEAMERAVAVSPHRYKIWCEYLAAREKQITTLLTTDVRRDAAVHEFVILSARACGDCPFPGMFLHGSRLLVQLGRINAALRLLNLGFSTLPRTQHRRLLDGVRDIAAAHPAVRVTMTLLRCRAQRLPLRARAAALREAAEILRDRGHPDEAFVVLAELLAQAPTSSSQTQTGELADLVASVLSARPRIDLSESLVHRLLDLFGNTADPLRGAELAAALAGCLVASGDVAGGRAVLVRSIRAAKRFDVFHALWSTLIALEVELCSAFPTAEGITTTQALLDAEEAVWSAMSFRRNAHVQVGLQCCDALIRAGVADRRVEAHFRRLIREETQLAADVVPGFAAYALFLKRKGHIAKPQKLLCEGSQFLRGRSRDASEALADLVYELWPEFKAADGGSFENNCSPSMTVERVLQKGGTLDASARLWAVRDELGTTDVVAWAAWLQSVGLADDSRRLLAYSAFEANHRYRSELLRGLLAVLEPTAVETTRMVYRELVECDPSGLRDFADFELRSGSHEAALELLEQLADRTDVIDDYVTLVNATARLQGSTGIRRLATRITSTGSSDPTRTLNRGVVLCRASVDASDFELARKMLAQLATLENPTTDLSGLWSYWATFETRHGSLHHFEDMLRAKRATLAAREGVEVKFDDPRNPPRRKP
jgi:hypothetical protein